MKIIFARHGQSQANLRHEFSNQGLKHPLTLEGRQQAAALADALQIQSVTYIYSSPVLRALETAIILAGRLGVEYEVAEALREYDVGLLEGRSDDESWLAWQTLDDAWLRQERWDQCSEGGESFYAVRQRFVPFIQRLVQDYAQGKVCLLCVGHGGLYRHMLPQVLINVDAAFITHQGGLPYTTFITAESTPRGLVCIAWNGEPVESPAP
jgi:probable phosphoglycerate mutase